MGKISNALSQAISMFKQKPEVYEVKKGIPLPQFGQTYSNGKDWMVDTVDPNSGKPMTVTEPVYAQFNAEWSDPSLKRNVPGSALIQAKSMVANPAQIKTPQTPQPTMNPIPSPTPTPVPSPTTQPTPQPSPITQAMEMITGRSEKYKAITSDSNKPIQRVVIQAAQEVGVNPSLMLDIAAQESMLNPNAKASENGFDGKTLDPKTGEVLPYSSATGLFQFTDGTWREAMKRFPKITQSMEDRTNPYINALVAASFLKQQMLSRWNASQAVWGPNYTKEEVAGYYTPDQLDRNYPKR